MLRRLGWARFLQHHHQQTFKSLASGISSIPHPMAHYLHRLARHGVPAPSSAPPWTPAQKDAAAYRGPHPSASRQHSAFLLQ
ncbi:MAG: hypothetical protein ACK55I_46420, partial [bacterium]